MLCGAPTIERQKSREHLEDLISSSKSTQLRTTGWTGWSSWSLGVWSSTKASKQRQLKSLEDQPMVPRSVFRSCERAQWKAKQPKDQVSERKSDDLLWTTCKMGTCKSGIFKKMLHTVHACSCTFTFVHCSHVFDFEISPIASGAMKYGVPTVSCLNTHFSGFKQVSNNIDTGALMHDFVEIVKASSFDLGQEAKHS